MININGFEINPNNVGVVTPIDWIEESGVFNRDGFSMSNQQLFCGFSVLSLSGETLVELKCLVNPAIVTVPVNETDFTAAVTFTDELDWKGHDFIIAVSRKDSGKLPLVMYNKPLRRTIKEPREVETGSCMRNNRMVSERIEMHTPHKNLFRKGIPMEALTLYSIRAALVLDLRALTEA